MQLYMSVDWDDSEEDYEKARELFDKILKREYPAVWNNWAFLEVQRD